jgi:hypothetical protein
MAGRWRMRCADYDEAMRVPALQAWMADAEAEAERIEKFERWRPGLLQAGDCIRKAKCSSRHYDEISSHLLWRAHETFFLQQARAPAHSPVRQLNHGRP